jgi:hypothetical protein
MERPAAPGPLRNFVADWLFIISCGYLGLSVLWPLWPPYDIALAVLVAAGAYWFGGFRHKWWPTAQMRDSNHEVKLAEPVTPHIPLGISVEQALGILQSLGNPVREQTADEHCHRLDTPLFSLAVYPDNGVVRSVWYNDPTGRESVSGRVGKVEAYLKRYGHLQNWERRLDNAWMHYWFNPIDQVQMVYGVHEDVIRFNQYQDQNA